MYHFSAFGYVPFQCVRTCIVSVRSGMYRFSALGHVPFQCYRSCAVSVRSGMYRFSALEHGVCIQTKAISALADTYHKKYSRLQGYLMLATFIREQAIPPRCPPRFETSIMRRLEAAYVLRGEKVELVDGLFVRYNLLPELSILHVFKRMNCRPWGLPIDVQRFTDNLRLYCRLGVIVMHHRLGIAFHFRQSEEPRLLDIIRALKYRCLFSECVLLAHIDGAEGTVFAYVDADFKSTLPAMTPRWLCDSFTWQAVRSSSCPFLQRNQQSVLSEASWDNHDDELPP